MPASVAGASPSLVMPYALLSTFSETRAWAADQNVYLNGECQSNALVSTSRKRWSLTQPLTATQAGLLRTFYATVKGPVKEFYFYNLFETVPQWSYDATGSATAGRYTVRFDSALEITLNFPRNSAQIAIIEVS